MGFPKHNQATRAACEDLLWETGINFCSPLQNSPLGWATTGKYERARILCMVSLLVIKNSGSDRYQNSAQPNDETFSPNEKRERYPLVILGSHRRCHLRLWVFLTSLAVMCLILAWQGIFPLRWRLHFNCKTAPTADDILSKVPLIGIPIHVHSLAGLRINADSNIRWT